MRIRIIEEEIKNPLDKVGVIGLIYAPTGVGKTVSSLKTLPGPKVLVYANENRDMRRAIAASGRDPADFYVVEYGYMEDENGELEDQGSFDDLINFARAPWKQLGTDKWEQVGSVLFDGVTQLCSSLQMELERSSFEARDKDKKARPLIDLSKMGVEGWGALASNMKRLMPFIGKYASQGKVVILTVLEMDNPTYQKGKDYGPQIPGVAFPQSIGGMIDIIGKVEPRFNEDGSPKYPPIIKFECGPLFVDDGKGNRIHVGQENFIQKWSGARPINKEGTALMKSVKFELDFNKILNYATSQGTITTEANEHGSSTITKE